MINENPDEFCFLKNNKTGERFDLNRARKWIITSLPYDDFVKLTTIWFKCNFVEKPYRFNYRYDILPKDDTPKRRIDYLEYLYYKIYQNLYTNGVELD